MQELPGDSASPPPRDEANPFVVTYSAGDRESVREAARLGQFDDLRSVAYNKKWIINLSYCSTGDSVDSFEPTLHNLWHVYYQGGRYISHKNTEHDRLVLDVLRTRGLGPLSRPSPNGRGIDIARTPAGVLWNDLPFLVTDMTDYWVNDCATMEASQRLNFASFLAKLASTRIDKDRLCQIALLLFRDTFESIRPLGSSSEPDDARPDRTMHDLSIAALLPATCTWIDEAGHNIIMLSDISWNDCPSSIGMCGETFVESELGQRVPGGFSPWRWMYWLKRLHEIADEAAKAGEAILAEHAKRAIEIILGHVEERNSKVLRVYKAAGENLHQDKDLLGLKKFLKEDQSSKGSE